MPVLVEEKAIDSRLDRIAEKMPTRPSRKALATAILRRASMESADYLSEWINSPPAPTRGADASSPAPPAGA